RAGVLHIVKAEGEKVAVGDLVARIDEDGAARAAAPAAKTAPVTATPAAPAKASSVPAAEPIPEAASEHEPAEPRARAVGPLSPAVRRLLAEHDLDPILIPATGKGGRLTKEDVLAHLGRTGAETA